MNKKYFETKTGSIEEKITQIATEQQSIKKQEPNVKLTVEKTYFETKPGSISDVAAKIVSEGLDPVNRNAVKKDFKDRQDKDIDNDGDTDSTDKYLHTRRQAISKNIKEMEYTSGGGMYALSAIKAKRQRIEKQLADLDRKDPKYAEKAKDLKDKIEKQKEIMQRKQKEVFDSYVPNIKEKKVECTKCEGKGCSHCNDKGYHIVEVKNAYAVGMAQAMKSKNDKPPLEKSTITKAHDIAKSIMKKEQICPKCGKDHANKINASNCMGESKKTFSDLRTETKVIKLGDKGKTATGKEAGAVDVEPRAIPV